MRASDHENQVDRALCRDPGCIGEDLDCNCWEGSRPQGDCIEGDSCRDRHLVQHRG